jgi:hypothetical protein
MSTTFFLDSNPSPDELAGAVNYLLANLSSSSTANQRTGQIIDAGGQVVGYLYKYIQVKYAQSYDGSVGFSNVPTGATYYGIRNSDSSTESTNPADYIWTQVTGGFGSTNSLWYLTTGSRSIQFQVASLQPNTGWVSDPGTAIDLDVITAAPASPTTFVVIRVANSSAAPTNAEVLSAIGRTPLYGDLCTVNYDSGIYSIQYKYTTGWAIFQSYITSDVIVAGSITGTSIAASTITGTNIAATTITASNIATNTITVNNINNIAVGQIIAGSINIKVFSATGTTSWTVPPYVYKAKITVVGGGGGGAASNAYYGYAAGGGGGGGGSIGVFTVTPGTVYTVVVGAGGGASSTGGASSVTGTGISIYGNGGGGGTILYSGSGGSASGGDINVTGGQGSGVVLSGYTFLSGNGGGGTFVGAATAINTSAPANSGGGGGGGGGGSSGGSGFVIIEY